MHINKIEALIGQIIKNVQTKSAGGTEPPETLFEDPPVTTDEDTVLEPTKQNNENASISRSKSSGELQRERMNELLARGLNRELINKYYDYDDEKGYSLKEGYNGESILDQPDGSTIVQYSYKKDGKSYVDIAKIDGETGETSIITHEKPSSVDGEEPSDEINDKEGIKYSSINEKNQNSVIELTKNQKMKELLAQGMTREIINKYYDYDEKEGFKLKPGYQLVSSGGTKDNNDVTTFTFAYTQDGKQSYERVSIDNITGKSKIETQGRFMMKM